MAALPWPLRLQLQQMLIWLRSAERPQESLRLKPLWQAIRGLTSAEATRQLEAIRWLQRVTHHLWRISRHLYRADQPKATITSLAVSRPTPVERS
ncbi:MAG: hypothetical protein J4A00_02520 [Gammaproteobacteria bacterium]|nr:hypothetical protein [Gammaproteobacteria bacterium]